MTSEFSHPLARAARVWTAQKQDGSEQPVLVIVTTMELDPANERYKEKLVRKLSRAATEYLAQSFVACAFAIDGAMTSVTTADATPNRIGNLGCDESPRRE